MIDCFITSCSRNKFRYGLALATYERMRMQDDLNVRVIRTWEALLGNGSPAITVECTPLEFRLKRRQIAEDFSTTPIYLICDDDVLPYHPQFVSEALRILKANPAFKFACLRPKNVDTTLPDGNEEVMETDMSAIGGCNFIHKGHLNEWPYGHTEADGWNTWEPKLLRGRGHKVGMFRNLWMNHVGVGFSTLWYNDNA